jgi:hypothetical protein
VPSSREKKEEKLLFIFFNINIEEEKNKQNEFDLFLLK